jgi:hypothetical protein
MKVAIKSFENVVKLKCLGLTVLDQDYINKEAESPI